MPPLNLQNLVDISGMYYVNMESVLMPLLVGGVQHISSDHDKGKHIVI